ncbi:N-carbamoyl-D-amino-acid hydrolase [Roseibium polysiphoniae]|uniref:N-carbamoyl-D-amino-acid hydrolase n=1 Tax=Roseibium polysiphoniae TaxID=2571221 RepID=A0ABR9C598_9HYPH|nr:N-carbamoyl-D-amino-acid hydrolase [Roseibium polysiphoniae]MBD8874708.1 N-carbamoyl-D-amino-acid hydrolase [Roseibium polysiphoniae]
MSRNLVIAAAQLGPIPRAESRSSVVIRMMQLMEKAASRGAELVVFPELALTTFFPRWYLQDQKDIDAFFETQMPSEETQPLFEAAIRLGLSFSFGYAEKTQDAKGETRRFNTSVLVGPSGEVLLKYRKIHLPGHSDHEIWRPFQHLEKRYFEVGDLGFPVAEALGGRIGMCICNDRRWPETFRILGLQRAELVLLGYNTPVHYPPAPDHDHLQDFHNHLSMQAGAYQNGAWVVGVAKAGHEEGCDLIGGSCIIAPTGEIAAKCVTLGDEVIVVECDLDRCREIQDNIFNFAAHRQPDQYGLLVEKA